MMYVALVIKSKLKFEHSLTDIVFVEADSKPKAISKIHSTVWPESWWIEGKSICQITRLIPITELPEISMTGVTKAFRIIVDYGSPQISPDECLDIGDWKYPHPLEETYTDSLVNTYQSEPIVQKIVRKRRA